MFDVNRVTLRGHAGDKPVVKTTKDGKPFCCELSLATTTGKDPYKHTEWHKVIIKGYDFETAAREIAKGDLVKIDDGEIRTRSWNDPQGNKRYAVEIHAFDYFIKAKKEKSTAIDSAANIDFSSLQNIPF